MIEQVEAIIAAGIPFVGHIGMLPQSVVEEGGYKKKGKTPESVQRLIEDALALDEAGACAVVLESMVPAVAAGDHAAGEDRAPLASVPDRTAMARCWSLRT